MDKSGVRTPKRVKQSWIFVRATVNALFTPACSGTSISKLLSVEAEAAATCSAARVSLQVLVT